MNHLYMGCCLEKMNELIEKGVKVDAIITDPPYGKTSSKWDEIIPFDKMWGLLERLKRSERTPVVLFGMEPFSSLLRVSNLKEFKYDWIWDKKRHTTPFLAKKQPLRQHEIISVFYKKQCLYNPQPTKNSTSNNFSDKPLTGYIKLHGIDRVGIERKTLEYGYPKTILRNIPVMTNMSKEKFLHPTYKPVALMEYLVKTYTNEGEVVLDFTMGSGSTGVACNNLKRDFIGIEKEKEYFDIAFSRMEESVLTNSSKV